MHILGAAFDSTLTLETHLRKVVSKTTMNLGVVCHAGKLFDCSSVLKSCFNDYILSSFEYCATRVDVVGRVSIGFAG